MGWALVGETERQRPQGGGQCLTPIPQLVGVDPCSSCCYSRRDQAGTDTFPQEGWVSDSETGAGPAPRQGAGRRDSPATTRRGEEEGRGLGVEQGPPPQHPLPVLSQEREQRGG